MNNLLLLTDSYKLTHFKQYPPKTEKIYSYFESRGGQFYDTVFFGLQYFLKRYIEGQVITQENIEEAAGFVEAHLGTKDLFNRAGWEYILNKHQGRLPVSIKAVAEGSVVPTHNVLMTIENTDPNCYWLTNYLETLLVQTWYPTTVATQSRAIRQSILSYLKETGDPAGIDFKLHDFGFRGVSSVESASIGGAAHLVNFMGTDTIAGISFINEYYGPCKFPGFSIPAAEHSTMTAWGRENEALAMENMLKQYPTGLVACVSDSYDIFEACRKIWGEKLKDQVLKRDGCLVVRPDSGNPQDVVVEVLNILGEKLGYEKNEKGYKVLNPKVRVIQGDGVNLVSIKEILAHMKNNGWSADNIAFGMGGALLQKLHRDTLKFAFKCCHATVDGQGRDVYKQPVTDKGKDSKKGRLKLTLVPDTHGKVYKTLPQTNDDQQYEDELKEVFRDGEILIHQTFDSIREKAKKAW